MKLWNLFGDGGKDMFIHGWHKRVVPEEHVEETRSPSPEEKLEAHIERIRQIPYDPEAIREREARRNLADAATGAEEIMKKARLGL